MATVLKFSEDDNFLKAQWSETTVYKKDDLSIDTVNGIRIYGYSPKRVSVQIRTRGAINENKNGVQKDAVSASRLDEGEITALIDLLINARTHLRKRNNHG